MMVNIFGTVIDTRQECQAQASVRQRRRPVRTAGASERSDRAEQFVQLNETIGAYDADLNWTGGAPATPSSPRRASGRSRNVFPQIYQSGLLDNAKNLAKVAMIDIRPEFGANIHSLAE